MLNVEDWARDWAMRRGRDDPEEDDYGCRAEYYKYIIKCCDAVLGLLYTLCDRLREDHTIPQYAIRTIFGRHRVINILSVAMPVDRARVLFKMQYSSVPQLHGMHWVSERHIEQHPVFWGQLLAAVEGGCTMNMRYHWIADLFATHPGADDPVLATCFAPTIASWQII